MKKSHIILACSILVITAGCSENAKTPEGYTILSNLRSDLDEAVGVKSERQKRSEQLDQEINSALNRDLEYENEAQGD